MSYHSMIIVLHSFYIMSTTTVSMKDAIENLDLYKMHLQKIEINM